MAHAEKRGPGRWRARYRGPDNRERSKTFATKRDADLFLAEIEMSKARGSWVDPFRGRQAFGAYAEAWLHGQGHLGRGSTVKVAGHLRNHIVPTFGRHRISAIEAQEIRVWLAQLSGKPATKRAVMGTFSRILGTAVKDGVIGRNPCEHVDLPPDGITEEMVFLDPSQIERLAQTVPWRYRAFVLLAAYSGLRWGELVALRPEHVDFLRGRVVVRESITEIGGTFQRELPKNKKSRVVAIPLGLCTELARHLEEHPGHAGTIFTGSQGGLLRRSWYMREYKPAVLAAELDPRLRFHDLRHTAAALAIAQGLHPKALMERLGHSTVRLTLDRYGHLFPALDDSLRHGLETVFSNAAASLRPGDVINLAAKAGQRPAMGR